MTIFFNDRFNASATLISIADVPEIAGISSEEFEDDYGSDLEALNDDMMMVSFTHEPEFE